MVKKTSYPFFPPNSMEVEEEEEKQTQYNEWLNTAKTHLESNNPSAAKTLLDQALKSNTLNPSNLIDRLFAITSVLLSDPTNPLSVLQIPPNPSPLSILSSYRRLSLLLLTQAPPLPFSSRAFNLVSNAYAQLSKCPAAEAGSFWTLCERCLHVHEYPKEYVGRRVRCYSCNDGFLAVEMGSPPEIVEGTNMYKCAIGLFPVVKKEEEKREVLPARRVKPSARKSVRPCPKKILGTVRVVDEEDEGGGDAW